MPLSSGTWEVMAPSALEPVIVSAACPAGEERDSFGIAGFHHARRHHAIDVVQIGKGLQRGGELFAADVGYPLTILILVELIAAKVMDDRLEAAGAGGVLGAYQRDAVGTVAGQRLASLNELIPGRRLAQTFSSKMSLR